MYGELAPEMLSDLVHRLGQQHEHFLQRFTGEVVEGLKAEIQRLKDENDRLKLQTVGLKGVGGQPIAAVDNIVEEAPDVVPSEPKHQGNRAARHSISSGASLCSSSREEGAIETRNSMERRQAESIEHHRIAKTRRRLRRLLGLKWDFVSAECLGAFLRERNEPLGFQQDLVKLAVSQLRDLQGQIPVVKPDDADMAPDCISLDLLAHLVCFPTLAAFVNSAHMELLGELGAALGRKTVAEAIESVTKGAEEDFSWVEQVKSPLWERLLNTVVCLCVVISTGVMGFQVDHNPYHEGWFFLELTCTAVFVAEVMIKLWKWGWFTYFCSGVWAWNLLDVVVTSLSALDIVVSALVLLADESRETPFVQSLRGAVILKTLRAARVLRLVKLLHSPLVRDLANMIVGLVIGLPCLLWVLLLFVMIVYVVGFVFRLTLGPAEGQNQIEMCGDPERFDRFEPESEDCIIHYMYGEMYFGTLTTSMFTSFRFMLGDHSTKSGKDLVVILSQGYGIRFDSVFVTWMILIHFGFFNIISALFVETTLTGLKHNDTKRKMLRQYERNYVRCKLKELLSRVEFLDLELTESGAVSRISRSHHDHQIQLTEESFIQIMDDDDVRTMLMDLDVVSPNPKSLFDTFDPDGHGRITGAEFVEALMKLRGEPQKHDVITSVLALRKLSAKIDDIQTLMLKDNELSSQDQSVFKTLSVASSCHPWSQGGSGGGRIHAMITPLDKDGDKNCTL